jgi:hypothetical protein
MRARDPAPGSPIAALRLLSILVTALFVSVPVWAWVDLSQYQSERIDNPHAIHVTDGSFVMNVGELQINITNWGLIGSQFTDISTFYEAPSAQWPAGSGEEYLWSAGLWIGGVFKGRQVVSTGQYEREIRPLTDITETIYEAVDGTVVRPFRAADKTGTRLPYSGYDDDGDGRMDEETLNGHDDDHDGQVDEDFGQLGRQMMVCTMYDNTDLAREAYPDHTPMGLKIVQKCFAWDVPRYRDFVGFDYDIRNVGTDIITDLYIGIFTDCDIGPRGRGELQMDDMVGIYDGLVRASDGTYWRVNVGYMYDGAEEDPLPGYFGVMFMQSGFSPSVRIRSFQHFAALRPFENGGEPTDDEGRYEMLSRNQYDANSQPGEENDYRFLVSTGPLLQLQPQQRVRVYAAMVIGKGLEGLLESCANALTAWRGEYYDLDDNPDTGRRGRETQLCFPTIPPSGHWIWLSTADFMDESCVPAIVNRRLIRKDDFDILDSGYACIWVNYDNCQECDRLAGKHCTRYNHHFQDYWTCNNYWLPAQARIGCTGILGREGQVPWIITRVAPPPPGMRLEPGDHLAHVYWNDDSEHAIDPLMQVEDFESYRVMRADHWDRPFGSSLENGPESRLWGMIAEFDLDNEYIVEREVPGEVLRDTFPLGLNTGLEDIIYRPRCLDDPRFSGLAEAMQAIVEQDSFGRYEALPHLRDEDGLPARGMESLLPWEHHRAALDTFFMVTPREADPLHGIVGKRSTRFYEYVDRDVHNGFLYFYAVTATDHALDWEGQLYMTGYGLASPPSSSFEYTTPGSRAQTLEDIQRTGTNIYVYPNPATLSSLAEFQEYKPNSDDPTGQRIMFANLPRCRNKISIFTLDGDLVQEIWHDGVKGHGEVSWNLVTRSGQQAVSGLYLYSVEPGDKRFKNFVGKFAIIK